MRLGILLLAYMYQNRHHKLPSLDFCCFSYGSRISRLATMYSLVFSIATRHSACFAPLPNHIRHESNGCAIFMAHTPIIFCGEDVDYLMNLGMPNFQRNPRAILGRPTSPQDTSEITTSLRSGWAGYDLALGVEDVDHQK